MDTYEKKYNEALERAKRWADGTLQPKRTTPQGVCEAIFPELAESEDERIINQLITLVDSTGEVLLIPTNKEELIAWLKKQKENPKSADSIPSDCVSDAKCEDKSPKHSDSDGTDIRDTPAYWKGWDDAMKQKEQKHPNGCFTCDEYKKGYEAGKSNCFTAGYNKAMKGIDQKEQKPVEWSEEDEDMLNSCISSIEEAKENRYAYKETDGDTSYDREINWLKSLRPSWKPSEEQMRCFDMVLCDEAMDENVHRVLVQFREQLKRLM